LSSAAVLAVYSAGFFRTRAAAERFAQDTIPPRPPAASFLDANPGPGSRGRGPADLPAPTTPAPAPERQSASFDVAPARPAARAISPAVSTPALPPAAARSDAISRDPQPAATVEEPASVPAAAPVAAPVQPAAPAVAEHTSTDPAAVPAPAPAAPAPVAQPKAHYKDGTFTGWGTSRHGDIEATVTIADGRIASAVISQCWTRYSCSWISPLPPQVPARQSAEVDYVSGATQSTYAFYYAVLEALSKAK
jgi:uncharacterized protein with FMN-binding domain